MANSNVKYQTPYEQSKIDDFINFRIMITPVFIKIIFILGLIALSILSFLFVIFYIFEGNPKADEMLGVILLSLILIIFLGAYWRVICELFILFFSMHEVLVSMEKSLHKMSHTSDAPLSTETSKVPDLCPVCGSTIPPGSLFCPNCGYKIK